jgi:hypothetical protein
MENMRNAYKIFVETFEGRRLLRRPKLVTGICGMHIICLGSW